MIFHITKYYLNYKNNLTLLFEFIFEENIKDCINILETKFFIDKK